MLAVIACLIGIFGLLTIAELLGKYKILKGEYHRKFLHITAASFVAFWPWLISWQAIRILGLIFLSVMLINRYVDVLNYRGRVGRTTNGDIFLALAIVLVATLTDNKIFFMLAMLEVALADGLAAIAGITYGKNWSYKIANSQKTVIGSMIFWLTTVLVFGAGLLPAHNLISLQDYYIILVLIPPLFTLAENVSVFGFDNLLIPLLTITVLRLAQF